MDGFPNFFIIFGPNTATGHSSVIMASENMIQYVLKFIKPVLKGDVSTVEVKKEAEIAYTADIQVKLKKTVWMSGGCGSWYYDKSGWNSTLLPYNQIWFWYRTAFPIWADWNINYTRKGLIKQSVSKSLKMLAFTAVLLGIYRARQRGIGLLAMLRSLYGMAGFDTAKLLAVLGIDRMKQLLEFLRVRLVGSS